MMGFSTTIKERDEMALILIGLVLLFYLLRLYVGGA